MKIAVIGGGPAGIIAAGFASGNKKDVVLIEKNNKLGKKLFITGKGRCNITNASPIEDFFDKIMSNNVFLYSAFYSFTNEDIMELLDYYGLKSKIERGNRVFPVSDKSMDVINTLERFLRNKGVSVQLNSVIKHIEYKNAKFTLTYGDGSKNIFDKVILATGGKSYPSTGSTGDGYRFAAKLGHRITRLKPSLVPIVTYEDWIQELQGVSLKNVSLSIWVESKKVYEEFGEMIFTHYGISGPIVLSMSNIIHKYDNKKIKFYIDLKPALSEEKLDQRILRDFEKYKNRQIQNGLNDLLPRKLIKPVVNLSSIDKEKPINQITKDERVRMLNVIKGLPLTFKKLMSIEQAIITSGGVDTREINPSTMESKLIPGLFFAGEIIDVDGLTGGYNLQIAYSTGYLAGMSV